MIQFASILYPNELEREIPDIRNYKEFAGREYRLRIAGKSEQIVTERPTFIKHLNGDLNIVANAPTIILGYGKGNIVLNAYDNILMRNIGGNLEAYLTETSYLENIAGTVRIQAENLQKIVLCPNGTLNGQPLGAKEKILSGGYPPNGKVQVKQCLQVAII